MVDANYVLLMKGTKLITNITLRHHLCSVEMIGTPNVGTPIARLLPRYSHDMKPVFNIPEKKLLDLMGIGVLS